MALSGGFTVVNKSVTAMELLESENAQIREIQRSGVVDQLTAAIAVHEFNPSWGLIQDVEGYFEYMSSPPESPIRSNPEDMLAAEENAEEIDAMMRNSQPQSALSAVGDGDGSPSSDPNSISRPLSPISPDSPESTMGPSDCENQPVSPCQSPCYSRPGSPWPMYARPSFKKTRNPFWTTFRVRDFR